MCSLSIKDLDSVIEGVTDDDVVVLVDCNSLWHEELSVIWSHRSKGVDVSSLSIKDLDSVIESVTDDDVVVLVDCNSLWCVELSVV